MARNLDAKCKQCRRAGEKLFLKGERCKTVKCAIVKRNYPPGFHGPKSKTRPTDYGMQLNEKQKAKKQYGILEKQFRLTFEKAQKKTGNIGDNFMQLLESRFDNVVARIGLASSHSQARQLISHGLLTINNKKVDIPSYIVKIGDVIKIKPNKLNSKIFTSIKEKIKPADMPGWISYDANTTEFKILSLPDTAVMKPNFNVQMIVEYYSR